MTTTITEDATLTIYRELLQGSAEWLEARRGLVTASTVGQLITPTLKVADNDKSRALTALLVSERVTGWSDPSYFNSDMQRGHDVEPIARDWYADKYGVQVDQVGFMIKDLGAGTRLGFSPDGLVGPDGLIEVKAPKARGHLTTHVSGEVPAFHLPQIQAGMFVSGRQWCDFISFYGGMPPFVKRVHADEKWFEVIAAAVERFEERASEMQIDYETKTTGLDATKRLAFDQEIF